MIETLLIANRGEIACRITRTCQRLGIRSVAVYSDADAQAPHVRLADEAIHVGPAAASESYLNIERILAAARLASADAIHPGYGFLAENADFARACVREGAVFVGPSAEAIEAMGNKRAARILMQEAGVPVVPGFDGTDQTDAAFVSAAQEVGFPLMVKAAAGGGGKGMRVVTEPDGLLEALAAARREGQQAFGSGELILERALSRPRHVEVQVFGDTLGNVIHLGERDCSIQRRYQKVIEESPAPGLSPELRSQLGEAAVAAARSIQYDNAGTVEFMLDEAGTFYFLEFNTRIQVEHPVTEMITGQDLIDWQIRVAEGEPLPWKQAEVSSRGHAIEARLYAEDPANEFLPATGEILFWREPAGEGVRVDSGIETGAVATIHYDPLLAKVIAHGPDRPRALRRLIRALSSTSLLGLNNNLDFLNAVLSHDAFRQGDLHTGFIEEYLPDWRPPENGLALALIAASLVQYEEHPQLASNTGYWRNNPNRPLLYRYQGSPQVSLIPDGKGYQLTLSNSSRNPEASPGQVAIYRVEYERLGPHDLAITVDGRRQRVTYANDGDRWWLKTPSGMVALIRQPLLPVATIAAGTGGSLRAPLPGVVVEVLVEKGQVVEKGQPLMKLEAMKMEYTIRLDIGGLVEAILYEVGDSVEADAELLRISGSKEAPSR